MSEITVRGVDMRGSFESACKNDNIRTARVVAVRPENPQQVEPLKSNLPAKIQPRHDVPFSPEPKSHNRKPPHYKVLFLNDDYTSFSFVFNELQRHFHKTRGEARDLTLDVHNKGLAVVGTYPYEVAEHKIGLVEEDARNKGYPFRATLERA
jgi:ATP-dependent Clp protease adaptor protein ClpS